MWWEDVGWRGAVVDDATGVSGGALEVGDDGRTGGIRNLGCDGNGGCRRSRDGIGNRGGFEGGEQFGGFLLPSSALAGVAGGVGVGGDVRWPWMEWHPRNWCRGNGSWRWGRSGGAGRCENGGQVLECVMMAVMESERRGGGRCGLKGGDEVEGSGGGCFGGRGSGHFDMGREPGERVDDAFGGGFVDPDAITSVVAGGWAKVPAFDGMG